MTNTNPYAVDTDYIRERYESNPRNPAYRYLAQAHGVIPYPREPQPETFGDIRPGTDAEHAKANERFQADIDMVEDKEQARE